MMELGYSPRHSPGSGLHFLSPTHVHGSALEGFSISQLRRSLSRSPSKPARHHLPGSLSAAFPASTVATPSCLSRPVSAASEPAPRPRFSVRRSGPTRSAARKTSPSSPLRCALGDSTNSANTAPQFTWRCSSDDDQENMDCSEDPIPQPGPPALFDEPIKLDFHKADRLLHPPKQSFVSPGKSSPLKRSDGVMNLESATTGSPRSKRRSLCGTTLANEFNIFSHGLDGTASDPSEPSDEGDGQTGPSLSAWPVPGHKPSPARPFSLRKSTLQQRVGPARSRPLLPEVSRDLAVSPALTRARSRISLDSALPLRTLDLDSSASRAAASDPPVVFPQPGQRPYQSAPKPHPLSHALTPSSSAGSVVDDNSQTVRKSAQPQSSNTEASTPRIGFSKSLPIGTKRPPRRAEDAASSQAPSLDTFATPDGYRMAKPLPQAFMSTGLISKRNRNLDMAPGASFENVNMPDTPSKKAHVLISSTPAPSATKAAQPLHEFGSPSTPYSRLSKVSPAAFGKSASIFETLGGAPSAARHTSFIDVDVDIDDVNSSPTQAPESHSSNDELPPTPTKSSSTASRPQSKGKSNSLRSSLFGRRKSLNPDTLFAAPSAPDAPPEISSKYPPLLHSPNARADKGQQPASDDDMPMPLVTLSDCATPSPPFGRSRSLPSEQFPLSPTPLNRRPVDFLPPRRVPRDILTKTLSSTATAASATTAADGSGGQSPHTPLEAFFAPPGPSSLSISVDNRPRTSFGMASANSFPPATPTGPRGDHAFGASVGPGHASSSYFANDVDTALTSRFAHVATLGIGEFSQVYKVEQALAGTSVSPSSSDPSARVWAVKKSRRPYTGNKDRQRKMREVQVLRALRGHEHLVELVDHWEAKNHLYIQTQFYENGNLKDFLGEAGFKGRLDDFRIWKILLELAQGVQSIHDADFVHLDLKPANIFIDWEGVLKIGDFGMASAWPVPPGLDGEGDREYIGPEVLSGRFDKPADIFAMGMIMLEIAGNIVLPDNGTSWQRLRAGDLSDLPSLTWSSDSSLARDVAGEPIMDLSPDASADSMCRSAADCEDDDLAFLRPSGAPKGPPRAHDLVAPPNFMVDSADAASLDRVVAAMIRPNPDARPRIGQLLTVAGVCWVEARRRAGATVYEGAWGPADDVLELDDDYAGRDGDDVVMLDS